MYYGHFYKSSMKLLHRTAKQTETSRLMQEIDVSLVDVISFLHDVLNNIEELSECDIFVSVLPSNGIALVTVGRKTYLFTENK